ncbi:proton extrusion protein PcxA [Anabaena cylindrica FACHB-243]|uniref:Proton extrusion protein PxcA n=1 Tax=Anabaena cylindrica (strain ATCC 27899 / PCC 7122) TaxID=272123 RepID=K9ZFG0_ANACC|nr:MULTISPECIES: proton extrusion protein PcxA [Anabaena]AFZ57312.1 envelope membrane protein [Anabaena cylindrica PCC 7122]MBD2420980.1 proton extrusion protein PcxA [Anabaena cylindrica FACHB-243]MBY5284738.1 proton extrusion protein PcxA [Anabaena sp. CCAP 1446/1C]MBY5308346.1 proton extrusion protein PcxA [Anabaena sp. CCAP 1446/1C]MCM2405733.1 proton extrusion protein PcxA [Anabaena sp. CCAP 1446/1C]
MKESYFIQNVRLIRQKTTEYWRFFNRWFFNTPERAILEAYQAAQAIQNIEVNQFNGKKIAPESENYTENVMAFWQGNLNRNLAIIKVRLAEFQLGSKLVNTTDTELLEKLKFIDEVICKYIAHNEINTSILQINLQTVEPDTNSSDIDIIKAPFTSQKTGVLPRSIGKTVSKITNEFTPKAEAEFVRNYRISRNRTRRSIKFLLMLIIVPLLTHHFSKQLLVIPLVEHVRGENTVQIFMNSEMEEKALHELKNFENLLKMKTLLQQTPEISPENITAQVKNKALEVAKDFRNQSSSAISNVFADLISLISFAIVVAFNKKNIIFFQSFIDEIVYGLSDSAKAFLIILLTDMFVGFHSPHGWEILLEGIAKHLGLSATRSGIFLFIATFPVILNTIFKYWIFRYLSRLSPSALATLKEMDE